LAASKEDEHQFYSAGKWVKSSTSFFKI
jgi:hypothetical protein